MEEVLVCHNIKKYFKNHLVIRNINLKFQKNTIYGLIGKNGSGKTTILNMISGLTFHDSGDIYVNGVLQQKGESSSDICYVRDRSKFLWNSSVLDILKTSAGFHKNWSWTVVYDLLDEFDIHPNWKCRKLSRGMETILGIIIGLSSRAPITIFDEPDLGLDSVTREKFYDCLLKEYTEFPRTMIISTHLVDEISKVLEKIYVIHSGEILVEEDIENLRSKMVLLCGKKENIDLFIEGKSVLYSEDIGHSKVVEVIHDFNTKDADLLEKLNISVENLSIQKLVTRLLERGNDREPDTKCM
ncbi:ABC transporter ATP-binding protein [Bacillus sp. WMMC1349]|uniref:ATP-binding cassette domain-containing protein n=1 Tax=Bacillus sp. WMMC1349 TaxID=2736254 RepID=UPI001555A5FC|nr:ABC transporter ATP-binding protein [Bacillus sp. WMMC1349]NPC94200.1 ABC transporter ATP-binding protein [Bacillus sp. WMMC1349]